MHIYLTIRIKIFCLELVCIHPDNLKFTGRMIGHFISILGSLLCYRSVQLEGGYAVNACSGPQVCLMNFQAFVFFGKAFLLFAIPDH